MNFGRPEMSLGVEGWKAHGICGRHQEPIKFPSKFSCQNLPPINITKVKKVKKLGKVQRFRAQGLALEGLTFSNPHQILPISDDRFQFCSYLTVFETISVKTRP